LWNFEYNVIIFMQYLGISLLGNASHMNGTDCRFNIIGLLTKVYVKIQD
jgi:hypothetical protein